MEYCANLASTLRGISTTQQLQTAINSGYLSRDSTADHWKARFQQQALESKGESLPGTSSRYGLIFGSEGTGLATSGVGRSIHTGKHSNTTQTTPYTTLHLSPICRNSGAEASLDFVQPSMTTLSDENPPLPSLPIPPTAVPAPTPAPLVDSASLDKPKGENLNINICTYIDDINDYCTLPTNYDLNNTNVPLPEPEKEKEKEKEKKKDDGKSKTTARGDDCRDDRDRHRRRDDHDRGGTGGGGGNGNGRGRGASRSGAAHGDNGVRIRPPSRITHRISQATYQTNTRLKIIIKSKPFQRASKATGGDGFRDPLTPYKGTRQIHPRVVSPDRRSSLGSQSSNPSRGATSTGRRDSDRDSEGTFHSQHDGQGGGPMRPAPRNRGGTFPTKSITYHRGGSSVQTRNQRDADVGIQLVNNTYSYVKLQNVLGRYFPIQSFKHRTLQKRMQDTLQYQQQQASKTQSDMQKQMTHMHQQHQADQARATEQKDRNDQIQEQLRQMQGTMQGPINTGRQKARVICPPPDLSPRDPFLACIGSQENLASQEPRYDMNMYLTGDEEGNPLDDDPGRFGQVRATYPTTTKMKHYRNFTHDTPTLRALRDRARKRSATADRVNIVATDKWVIPSDPSEVKIATNLPRDSRRVPVRTSASKAASTAVSTGASSATAAEAKDKEMAPLHVKEEWAAATTTTGATTVSESHLRDDDTYTHTHTHTTHLGPK
jgi:hypothetical protein